MCRCENGGRNEGCFFCFGSSIIVNNIVHYCFVMVFHTLLSLGWVILLGFCSPNLRSNLNKHWRTYTFMTGNQYWRDWLVRVKRNYSALAILFWICFSRNSTMTIFSLSEQPERNLLKKEVTLRRRAGRWVEMGQDSHRNLHTKGWKIKVI